MSAAPQKPPPIITDLIERFAQNADAYRSQAYNETQVRQEFITPFFEALGWDIANKSGHAEAYKDVIHEDAIKVGAPDYCFRIGGARMFFLEAKRPDDKTKLQRQIDATDHEIDRLVYDLYGLTEEEITIVEGKANTH